MDERFKKFLEDIAMAIDNIRFHLQEKNDFILFQSNKTIRSAVRYEFSVIGEALYKLLKLKPEFTISDSSKIIGLRNKMVHEYDMIDDAQVWNIIINYLPKLETEVQALLER